MVAANFCVTDGVWSDVRLTEAALGAFALRGDMGSLSPVDSVTLLALDATDPGHSRSWRVVTSAEGRRAEWAVAVRWKKVPGGELLSL
eukprot:922928-Alexandrium_andersonii.AAC.1